MIITGEESFVSLNKCCCNYKKTYADFTQAVLRDLGAMESFKLQKQFWYTKVSMGGEVMPSSASETRLVKNHSDLLTRSYYRGVAGALLVYVRQ
ncbi:unnamed protein product [Lactuca virosa]|uniref:Uncharacterized protein n=1 Tax=Lactuca virosa TaxID=75947 RepID=A0AAU9MT31_9ASTR|nr:unnamed protein product [Lactuca virosa]